MDAVRTLTTVLGPLAPERAGVTDAHQHVWIERVPGAAEGSPVLDDRALAEAGLAAYRTAGGGTLLDCQPGGCGRNASMLAELSKQSGVSIVAATGFHLRRYYPPDYWLWSATAGQAAAHVVGELQDRMVESAADEPVRAGFIKIAYTAKPDETPAGLLEGAAEASRVTGAAVLIHTEQGAAAEEIIGQLSGFGADPRRIILCHMDKRPDPVLHKSLADAGVLLEYDTFFRPKYDPARNVWPLLERMLSDGYEGQIALGTDLADVGSWQGVGPAGLPLVLIPRMRAMGWPEKTIGALTGGNVVSRLAKPLYNRLFQEGAHA